MVSKGGPGTEVPVTTEIAKRLGFINLQAYENYQRLKGKLSLDEMLLRIVNLEQMLLETKGHVEEVDHRLTSTGTELIG